METQKNKRSTFSGKIGFVLSAAGASVGLGNIWRFPYLAAKYGGGIFLLIYILLALTFGYTMIVAESALGRMTRKSPVGAFKAFGKKAGWLSFGGWINAIIPVLIVPYYSVIGGWVIKYLIEYVKGNGTKLAADGYFSEFISNGASTEICFVIFLFVYIVDHLCRCEKWNRKSFKVHDADFGRSVCHYCDLFCDKTGSCGRSEMFPLCESEELFMDDGCGSYGTDVLFPVYCYGYSDYIWLLYEKRQFH